MLVRFGASPHKIASKVPQLLTRRWSGQRRDETTPAHFF